MTTSHLLPRAFGQTFPVIVRAEGIRLWDADGNEYIDGTSGAISVASVGHGRREVADAMHAQVMRMDYVHDNEFHNEPAHALATKVTAFAGGDFSRAVFFSSGSEAIESAIKLAHNYHALNGRSRAQRRHRAASGASTAPRCTRWASATSRRASRCTRATWRCPRRRSPRRTATAARSARPTRSAAWPAPRELESTIRELGPENVSAFVAEPVVGAAAPALTPPAGYYEAIREVCDRYGVLWIADEIVTGFGRTGRNMGYMHWDAQPDILVVAKGMSGGYVPLSGLIISAKVVAPVRGEEGPLHPRPDLPEPPGRLRRRRSRSSGSSSGRASSRTRPPRAPTSRRGCARWSPGSRSSASCAARACCGAWSSSPTGRRRRASTRRSASAGASIRAGLANGLVIYQSGGSAYASDEVFISPSLIVTRDDIDEIVAPAPSARSRRCRRRSCRRPPRTVGATGS